MNFPSSTSAPAMRSLFGNAIHTVIPPRFVDVSDFRQVPNNQEVFADANTDQSIIIEIVEHQPVPDKDAAKYFFDDLAEVNGAFATQVIHSGLLSETDLPLLPKSAFKSFIFGEQAVSKYKEHASAANKVQVYLATIRLPEVTSDVLITFNVPVHIAPSSSSAVAQPLLTDSKENMAVIQTLLQSFQIKDWGLFTGRSTGADEDAGDETVTSTKPTADESMM